MVRGDDNRPYSLRITKAGLRITELALADGEPSRVK